MTAPNFDLCAIGEALLRLSPPRNVRIDRTDTLDIRVSGSQLNVAADCAALGLKTVFLSQLPDSPLGDLAKRRIAGYGVDTSMLRMIPDSRIGSTYVEFSTQPRAPRAVYDRKCSAASLIDENTYDWDAVAAGSAVMYTDGIFPALSAGCRRACKAYLEAGRKAGRITAFDMNFRSHLWTAAEACECWSGLLPMIDISVINRNVCESVFGMTGSDRELTEKFAAEFGIGKVLFTSRSGEGTSHGGWHAILRTENGEMYEDSIEFDIVDRYGSGDAWFAGFLTGIRKFPPDQALRFANCVIALAHTTFGDVLETSAAEAEDMISGTVIRLKR